MTIHVIPPAGPDPAPDAPDGLPLDPFWAAVRRRRPDLPLVLLDGPADSPLDSPLDSLIERPGERDGR